jgi:hypothetical protein
MIAQTPIGMAIIGIGKDVKPLIGMTMDIGKAHKKGKACTGDVMADIQGHMADMNITTITPTHITPMGTIHIMANSRNSGIEQRMVDICLLN